MTWVAHAVEWAPAAQRDLRRLDKSLVRRIFAAVDEYAATGAGDVKRLQGVEHLWRLRVGSWRVIFDLMHPMRVVLVARVRPRGSAYR